MLPHQRLGSNCLTEEMKDSAVSSPFLLNSHLVSFQPMAVLFLLAVLACQLMGLINPGSNCQLQPLLETLEAFLLEALAFLDWVKARQLLSVACLQVALRPLVVLVKYPHLRRQRLLPLSLEETT
jgi:hypothetical protein